MRVLFSTYEVRGDVSTTVGLAGALAAAPEECDAPAATGVMPTGGWR
jgi:hypothetical protein